MTVYEDLTLALLDKDFRMNVVFRSWNDDLVPEREVRCFVNEGRVTAMTQVFVILLLL